MRIALLSHSYHKVTGSSNFVANILGELGTVETYFDESWARRQADWVAAFEPRQFDCIVILQAHECFQYVNADHPNVVFIPMYDAMMFHREVTVRNPASVRFQYYPDPEQYPQVQEYGAPRGYYWRRTKEIDEKVIRRLTKGFAFEHFTLHNVPDPGGSITRPNVYFAPRFREGIGFAFLKAMSMRLCSWRRTRRRITMHFSANGLQSELCLEPSRTATRAPDGRDRGQSPSVTVVTVCLNAQNRSTQPGKHHGFPAPAWTDAVPVVDDCREYYEACN